ncbi:MAG TPA: DUF3060 domain-containing protein [Chitinophagales bacterium]|nr:DUF3060 domain-containing protein [Chitinophagales bacterium]
MSTGLFNFIYADGNLPAKTNIPTKTLDTSVLRMEESNLEKELTLNDKDVVIAGNDNKITIHGYVEKLSILGKNNEIDVESVHEIYIKNDYNFVSWQATPNKSGKPIISDKGGYNNIGKRTIKQD